MLVWPASVKIRIHRKGPTMTHERPGYWRCVNCSTHVHIAMEKCPVCDTTYLQSSRLRSAIRAIVFEVIEELRARDRPATAGT